MKIKPKRFKHTIIFLFIVVFSTFVYGQKPKKQGEKILYPKLSVSDSIIFSRQYQLLKESDSCYYECRVLWSIYQWNKLRATALMETQLLLESTETFALMKVEKSFNKFLVAAEQVWREDIKERNKHRLDYPLIYPQVGDDELAFFAFLRDKFIATHAQILLINCLTLKKYENKEHKK